MIVEFLLSLTVSLGFACVVLLVMVKKLKSNLAKITEAHIDLQASVNYIDGDIHTQNFIKFLSDSREMAFNYIDDAQQQIKHFVEIADKHFAFFDSWGDLSQDQLYYEDMKIISSEYKKLRSLLPEEK